jgi:hypothetical protein
VLSFKLKKKESKEVLNFELKEKKREKNLGMRFIVSPSPLGEGAGG